MKVEYKTLTLTALLLLASPAAFCAQDPLAGKANEPFIKTTGVPEGFEQFLEPQTTAVDLFYGGRLITTTIARYTPTEIELLKPEQVSVAIPGLKDPAALQAFLSKPVPSHSDKICSRPNQPLCGNLMPDVAALIFDENRFRATLFVNPNLLSPAQRQDPRYLPAPNQGAITLVQNLSALSSGDSVGRDQFSIFGTTRAGYKGHYGFADWISTDQQTLSFDQIGYRHVLQDHEITTGLYEPTSDMLRGLRRDLLVGAAMATSVKRRQDLASIIATPIEVFLPTRGRVDIFRDGRLIGSGFYEAGNQMIDNERLPAGAYLIDIVITDDNGGTSTLQQLFVKSTLLPPPGQPQWFAEAGQVHVRSPLENFPDRVDTMLIRSGYRWRHNDWLGFGIASAITESEGLLELSGNFFNEWSEFGSELYSSSRSGWGWGMRGSSRIKKNTLSVSAQRNYTDSQRFIDNSPYPLIAGSRWLYTLQISRPIYQQGLVSANYSRNGNDGAPSTRTLSVRYLHNISLANGKGITLSAEAGDVNGDSRYMLGFQWRASSPHWSHSAGLDWTASELEETDGFAATLASRWRDLNKFTDDIELGASARFDENNSSLNLDGSHISQYGRGRAAVSTADGENGNQQQYLVGYDTSIVMDAQRRLAIGGPVPGTAAAIIDLQGADGAKIDIFIDGQRQFTARGGTQTPVILPAYDTYQLNITDRGTELVSMDPDAKEITSYVGSVGTLSYEIERVNILVARLIWIENVCSDVTNECYRVPLPIRNTRVIGAEGLVFTDSEGYFQAEVSTLMQTLQSSRDGITCQANISTLEANQGVIRARRLLCEPPESAKQDMLKSEEETSGQKESIEEKTN